MATQVMGTLRWSAERRFYAGMALAILAAVFLGFARTFFLRPWFPEMPAPPETFFYIHGSAFAAWIALLIVQPSLVAAGRIDLHRTLGKAGAVLAVVMVVLGTLGALIAARRPAGFIGVPMPALQFLAIPLPDMVLFALFTGLAFARRRDPQSHKRLMLIASITIMDAAVARWPFAMMEAGPPVFFGLTDLFLLPIAVWDFRTRGRLHPVTLWGGLLIIVMQPVRLWMAGTAGWLRFAEWAVGLPG